MLNILSNYYWKAETATIVVIVLMCLENLLTTIESVAFETLPFFEFFNENGHTFKDMIAQLTEN